MDIKTLNVEYGDIVVLTYNEDADLDAIRQHYTSIQGILQETCGCITIVNREDLLKNITILKNDSEVFPFR